MTRPDNDDFVRQVVAVILAAAGTTSDHDARMAQWKAALAVRARWGGERHYFAKRAPEERAAAARRLPGRRASAAVQEKAQRAVV